MKKTSEATDPAFTNLRANEGGINSYVLSKAKPRETPSLEMIGLVT